MNLQEAIKHEGYLVVSINVHLVQRRRDVAHQGHEKEWRLQYRVLDEGQAVDDLVVPFYSF